MISINLGDQLLAKGQTREAEIQYRNALETAPDFAYVHSRLGLALLKESRYDEAIAAIEKAMSRLEQPEVVMPDLIYAYWVVGRKDDARQLLAALESKSAREYVSNVFLAQANAAVGMKERAIELLFKAAAERSSILQQSMIEPQFDQLRSDPRFQNLLNAMGMRQES